ncbi:peptide deformylase [Arenicella sp. 4NH20-0111]
MPAMAILEILVYPDERLRKIAEPVENVDKSIQTLVNDMTETMYDANGIGLAATQVDVHKQVIVMDLSEERNESRVLINPTIIEKDGEQIYDEGCLSVPEYYAPVKRAERIKITALDEQGEIYELEADGLLAVCIQHEMDHLAGRVFVDYLSRLKQDRVRKKLVKRAKSA